MIVIRDEQLTALCGDRLPAAIVTHLREHHSGRLTGLSDERIDAIVSAGIAAAGDYGITRDEDVCLFVALMFEVSVTFYRHPLVARILEDFTTDASERLERLVNDLNEAEWTEVAADWE